MSVQIMGLVWKCPLPKDEKFILLAYADHADPDGGSVRPSKSRIERMTGYSRSMVYEVTKRLIEQGIMTPVSTSQQGVIEYQIDADFLEGIAKGGPQGGPGKGVRSTDGGGPQGGRAGVRSTDGGGPQHGPKPSLNHQKEPSENRQGGGAAKAAAKTPPPEPTPDGKEFAGWFRSLLPEHLDSGKLPQGWESRWARTFDDLIRIDGKTPEEIRAVCQWARGDGFWSQNFFSPGKLRERGRGSDLKYVDLWQTQMKQGGRPQTAAAAKATEAAKTYPLSHQDRPKAFDPMAQLEHTEAQNQNQNDDSNDDHAEKAFPI